MSWSTSVPATPYAEFAAAVDAAVIVGVAPSPWIDEQLAAAKAAVKAIVASSAVGDSTCSYSATMSGHANAEHEPTEGWANDCLTVIVQQAPVSAPA